MNGRFAVAVVAPAVHDVGAVTVVGVRHGRPAVGLRDNGRPVGGRRDEVEEALRSLVAEERLDAPTLCCFDLIGARAFSGCLVLSALNDEGVAAGCEGDLPSAMATRRCGACW